MDEKKEYHFLKEETKKVPVNKKRFVKKVGGVVVLAAIFGAVAFFVFAALERTLMPSKEEVQSPVAGDSTMQEEQSVPDTVVVQEEPTLEGYEALQTELYSIGNNAAKSVVEITSVSKEKTWFEDDYEYKSQSSGVILSIKGNEVLILTDLDQIHDASEIGVTFYGDETVEAGLKAYDNGTGIAILAVDKRELSTAAGGMIQPVKIAETAGTTPGSFVVGIGSPQGEANSVVVGNITAYNQKISFTDTNYRLFTTSIEAYPDAGGVLLDSSGSVIGLICQRETHNALKAINIMDVKDLLNRLASGKQPAYLGVRISEVTVKISNLYGLPDGIYVKEVEMESPAFNQGLQEGDIITKIDGKEVLTESQFEEYMMQAEPGQKITVTVKRLGSNDTYQDVTCKIELGPAT